MRQVPRYAIIGDGRVARHFCHYFTLLEIPFLQWSRSHAPDFQQLKEALEKPERILVLIKDSVIESFITEHLNHLKNKIFIHFSGQLVTPLAYSAHPLMTFSNDLYELDAYQKIPFILEKDARDFNELFPELNNPFFCIPAELKSYYHSLCVMANNFSCILWQKLLVEFETKLNIPKTTAYPLLKQTAINLIQNSEMSLTGPLARGDQKTIQTNLTALKNDDFLKIYQAFVEVFNINRGEL